MTAATLEVRDLVSNTTATITAPIDGPLYVEDILAATGTEAGDRMIMIGGRRVTNTKQVVAPDATVLLAPCIDNG